MFRSNCHECCFLNNKEEEEEEIIKTLSVDVQISRVWEKKEGELWLEMCIYNLTGEWTVLCIRTIYLGWWRWP